MDDLLPRPKFRRDWKGLVVESLVSLSNQAVALPAGTRYIVTKNFGGLNLQSEPCPHCGLVMFVRYIPEKDVCIVGKVS